MGGDYYDEAQPVFEASASTPPTDDGEGPPIEELESQMRGEMAARAESTGASPAARRAASASDEEGEDKNAPLPELDALVARLPSDVRETLDELFRARFNSVKKLPKKAFQSATRKKAGSG